MAIGGSGKGIQIVVGTDYNDRDLKRAQRDLDRLKTQAGKTMTPMQKLGSTMRGMVGPAFAMAAAAAAGFAVKLAVDGVKAAMDEQAAVVKLEQALANVGQAFASDEVNTFIDNLQFATGVADDQLRPAFQTLVTATRDVTKAQELLGLALDISVGTGRSLESVTLALAKAANGQTTALRRLGVPLSDAAVKSGDLDAITGELSDAFSGQAAAAADTYAGKLSRLQIAAEELQEAFGTGFLSAFDKSGTGSDDFTDALRDLQPAMETIGKSLGDLVVAMGDLSRELQVLADTLNIPRLPDWANELLTYILGLPGLVKTAVAALGLFTDDTVSAADAHRDYRDAAVRAHDASADAAQAAGELGAETADLGEDALTAAESLQILNDEMSEYFGFLDDRAALRGYQASVDDLRKSLKENGNTFNINTEAGRDNQAALDDIYDSALKVAEGQQSATQKVKTMADASASANKILKKMGIPEDVRIALLKPFDDAIIAFQTGTTEVGNLKAAMEGVPRNVPITVTTTYVSKNSDSKPPQERAAGGLVTGPGTSTSDSIPVRMSNGEFVIRAASVRKFGTDFFSQLNRGVNPLAGLTPSATGRAGSGLTINGGITVNSVAAEGADTSIPRALRRMAFLAGMS